MRRKLSTPRHKVSVRSSEPHQRSEALWDADEEAAEDFGFPRVIHHRRIRWVSGDVVDAGASAGQWANEVLFAGSTGYVSGHMDMYLKSEPQ